MSKLLKATKKISAIAASALMLSSASFANLSNYNSHFEKSGEFVGEVVVGSGVGADDSESANVVIADLRDRYSGEAMVELRYSKSSSSEGGEVVNAVKDNNALNYGETLGSVSETSGYDDSDFDILEDGSFENDHDDVDYEQTLYVAYDDSSSTAYGSFNYRLYDEVDETEIADGVFFGSDSVFAKYILNFNSDMDISNSDDRDKLIGGTLEIMGQEFTVGGVSLSGSSIEELELLGGANKFSLSEGDSQTVTFEGKTVEIEVTNVDSEGKTRIVVNGVSEIVERYDVKEVNGVDIAVVDSVGATGDGIVGAAEFIVGGSKILLSTSEIEINDEEVDEMYEEYDISVAFRGDSSKFDGFEITYKVDDDTLLKEGDSLREVLLDTFSLVYEGVNEVEYSEFKVSTDRDGIDFSGALRNGESVPSEFKAWYSEDIEDGTASTADGALYLGGEDYRLFFDGSIALEANTPLLTAGDNTYLDDNTRVRQVSSTTNAAVATNLTEVVFTLNTATTNNSADDSTEGKFDDFGLFVNDKSNFDEQYLYAFNSFDFDKTTPADTEIDFNELMEDTKEDNVEIGSVGSDLEDANDAITSSTGTAFVLGTTAGTATTMTATLAKLDADGTNSGAVLALDNGLLMDFANIESNNMTSTASTVVLSLDADEVDSEDGSDITNTVTLAFTVDSTDDETLRITGVTPSATWKNDGSAEKTEGSDVEVYVDAYGTQVEYDTDSDAQDDVTVRVPDEQVEGMVNLVFGNVEMSEATKVVKSSEADEEYARLQEEGFSVERSDLEASDVEFSVTAPVSDSEASGENMIVVGGPAVNSQARALLGMSDYSAESAGLSEGQAVVRYFSDKNSVLAYGWSKAGTMAAVKRLVDGSAVDNQKFDE